MTRYDLWNGKSQISALTLGVRYIFFWCRMLRQMIWNLTHLFTHFYNSWLLIALADTDNGKESEQTHHKHMHCVHRHAQWNRIGNCELKFYFKVIDAFLNDIVSPVQFIIGKDNKRLRLCLAPFFVWNFFFFFGCICLFVRSLDTKSQIDCLFY